MLYFWTLVLAVLSALLYRLGGMSKVDATRYAPWKWMPQWAVNTKARDIGCSLIACVWIAFVFPGLAWWIHLLSFAFVFAALTTYWDDMFNGVDNFYVHGLGIALAYTPYGLAASMGMGFTLRCIVLAVAMGVLCKYSSNDYVEECGRGALIILTLPLLLI